MRKILPILALGFALPGAVVLMRHGDLSQMFAAFAEPPGLMQGCGDVPEAVALAEELRDRALRIERYLESVEARKAELAAAQTSLTRKLVELRAEKTGIQSHRSGNSAAVRDDIQRLIAVYDQMKPAEAAAIISNLPPDFAAEILIRLQPENGARIIASVEPQQAALLTAEMGARSVRKQ
ncbi:MotE family protein [Paracoccus homiensis]|uniref:MgtE intracellular N domain-containing protein n=1 Tax=Paracoccus homiensis TaxID=364199 RepID=A0A1H9YSS0_9RHOB|nr:hypothetical protein [Paracoccus homiensis]SES72209.1 MgtE intracellular N domain-containing protein [Paracoccus homiensis]